MKIDSPENIDLTLAASSFAALGSEQRLGVLRTLVRAGPDGLSIGELGKRSGVTGSTLTHHVKLLAQAGLCPVGRTEGVAVKCIVRAVKASNLNDVFYLAKLFQLLKA
ncbi:MAG: helix-turn-helix domain-containing protein [Pseudomonadota bacterium]